MHDGENFIVKAKELLHKLEQDYDDADIAYRLSLKLEPREMQFSKYVKKETAKSRFYGALEMYHTYSREVKI